MRVCSCLFLAALGLPIFAQGHDTKVADGLEDIAFMKGNWIGKQEFVTGGEPMVGDATNLIAEAIGGRYLEEKLSTTLSGRKASDTRHFITFDPKAGVYKAWWFNDSSVGAMELEGKLESGKLVMTSRPVTTGAGNASVFRVTYESPASDKLTYRLELKDGESWRSLFTTTYSKN